MRETFLAVVLSLTSVSAFGARHHKARSAAISIHAVYVEGNNEAAVDFRQELIKAGQKLGSKACFVPAGNENTADAILEVDVRRWQGGVLIVNNNPFALYNFTVTGTLSDQKGNLLWKETKYPRRQTAHAGATTMLRALWKAAGCKGGKR